MYCVELSVLLHRALESRVAVLQDRLAVPDWPADPETLHQVRVASRRVRAVLDLVDPQLYPAYDRQTKKLRRLTRALGQPREMDVHEILLESLRPRLEQVSAGPCLEHVLERFGVGQRRIRAEMIRELGDLSLKHLDDLLRVPVLANPFTSGDLAAGVWECLAPWVERAFRPMPALLDQEDEAALHGLRIDLKRLRYALEILAPAFGEDPADPLRLLKGLQKALGDHHDLATLAARVQELHQGLEERNRMALATGTRAILALVAEERQCAFEQFRVLAMGTSLEGFEDGLKRLLRPDPGARPQ
jgi:CHAD domain-containing protein